MKEKQIKEETQDVKADEIKLEDIKKMNIFEKLSFITKEIGVVAKNLDVGVGRSTYKAVGERDVLDAVKPIENKYRVYSYPVDREIVESDTLTKESEYQGKKTTSNSLYLRIKVVYRFINIDKTDEFIDITSYADGIDTGDKATGKAMTYADKYALMKAYKISTGEDPDKDASPENGYKGKSKSTSNVNDKKEVSPVDVSKELEERKITPGQKMVLDSLSETSKAKICENYKVKEISELTMTQASQLIASMQRKKEEK